MYHAHRHELTLGPKGIASPADVRLTHPLLDSVHVPADDAAAATQWAERLLLWKAQQGEASASNPSDPELDGWIQEQLRLACSAALADWKCCLLDKVGLTYELHACSPETGKARLTVRQKQIRQRIEAFRQFGVSSERFQLTVPSDPVAGLPARYVQRIVARAQMFSQPLRVRWKAPMLSRPSLWWLWSIEQRPELQNRGLFHLALHRVNANGDGVEEFISAEVIQVLSCGYSEDGAYYQLTVQCKDGSELTIDYDAYLSDQSHQHMGLTPHGDYPSEVPVLPFAWEAWLASEHCPARFTTAESTSSKAFNAAYSKLQALCSAQPGVALRSTGADKALYRFVEHMLEKVIQNTLPRSHRERLSMLEFTWGRQRATAADLFSSKL